MPFRLALRATRIGLWTTAVVLFFLLVLGVLPLHGPFDAGPVVAVLTAVALASLGVAVVTEGRWRGGMAERVTADRTAIVRSEHRARLLSRLSRRLLAQLEQERERAARGLNDELAQLLTSITYYSRRLEHDLDGEDAERAERIAEVAHRAIAATRGLIRSLRPAELDRLGLAGAVRRLAADVEEGRAISVVVRTTGLEDRLPVALETMAYRVIDAALSNVLRHAGATEVESRRAPRGARFDASVRDDGRGFDTVAASRAETGVGLVAMLERARLVGGDIRIQSAPGRGTIVRLVAPVRAGSRPPPTPGSGRPRTS